MSWRVAKSLDVLLDQINAAFPNRNKASDGSIGDAAHASRESDHNPWYGPGIVTARDYTHDPAHGADMGRLTDQLAASRDPRIKYVIFNRLILDSRPGNNPWRWMPYNGSNPHTKHMHVSVMDSPVCDDTRGWNLPMLAVQAPAERALMLTAPMMVGDDVKVLQRVLNAWYPWLKLAEDGVFGPATDLAVRELQRRAGLVVDGIVGPATRKTLGL